MKKSVLLSICLLLCSIYNVSAQKDSIKLLFIYGSKKWFGGIHGGHVGIQTENDVVLNFHPTCYRHFYFKPFNIRFTYCHIIPHNKACSCLERKTVYDTWQTFPPYNYNIDSLKRAIVTIPINAEQRKKLNEITTLYLTTIPYNYASLGMRCASSSYEMLSQFGIFKRYSRYTVWLKVFIPRKLRTIAFKTAALSENKNSWKVQIHKGSRQRKWEKETKNGLTALKKLEINSQE